MLNNPVKLRMFHITGVLRMKRITLSQWEERACLSLSFFFYLGNNLTNCDKIWYSEKLA